MRERAASAGSRGGLRGGTVQRQPTWGGERSIASLGKREGRCRVMGTTLCGQAREEFAGRVAQSERRWLCCRRHASPDMMMGPRRGQNEDKGKTRCCRSSGALSNCLAYRLVRHTSPSQTHPSSYPIPNASPPLPHRSRNSTRCRPTIPHSLAAQLPRSPQHNCTPPSVRPSGFPRSAS